MNTADPLIGRQLDNYRIERMLGQGGMARVYYAYDVQLARPAAIKVISEAIRGRSSFAERFIREARAMASWRHPNIPQVYHAGEVGGTFFYAMEFIQGMDLERLLDEYARRCELMPHADVLRIGAAVAAALDYAHARGTIHRDVKPGNVLVARDGRILLTDFGLLMQAQVETRGEVFGSPHYIAPEQALNSATAVAQTDIYALGISLYQMLTGTLPFHDSSPTALALKHIQDPPPPPREKNPALPPAVDSVLLRALEKRPQDRYPSALDLISALSDALDGKAAPAAAPQIVEKTVVVPPADCPDPEHTYPVSRLEVNDLVRRNLSAQPAAPQPAGPDLSRKPTPPTQVMPATPPATALELPGQPGAPATTGAGVARRWGVLAGCLLAALAAGVVIIAAAALVLRGLRADPAVWAAETTGAPLGVSATAAVTPEPAATEPFILQTEPSNPAEPAGPLYRLLLLSRKDDSLFLINQSEQDLPLRYLQIGAGQAQVVGIEWGIETLGPGQCVTVWKTEGKPKAPKGANCEVVGQPVGRSGGEKFWTQRFEVLFREVVVGECEGENESCTVEFEAATP